jgi:hypothetical protein
MGIGRFLGDSNFIVAVGTTSLAVTGVITMLYNWKLIKAAETSAKASRESAEATKVSVERMKDSLMPYLDLNIKWEQGMLLTIRNVGPGLGKIRLVTSRNDIEFQSIWDPIYYWSAMSPASENMKGKTRINDFVIGSKEEYTFQLRSRPPASSSDVNSWLSSLSIYYEDVYGRIYRSRVIYTWDPQEEIRVTSKESFPDILPIEVCSNVQQIYDIEGEIPVIFKGQYLNLHRIRFQKRILGTKISGAAFTNNEDLTLQKVSFQWHGNPDFQLQIGNKRPFKLASNVNNNGSIEITISDLLDEKPKPYSVYGLLPDGNDGPKLVELYQAIEKTLNPVDAQQLTITSSIYM